MQSGSATGPPTPTLAFRGQRRQTVRAEGRVGEGRAPGPRPGFASSRRTGCCTTPVCDGGKRQPSRFAVAAFVIPDFTTLQRFIAKRRACPQRSSSLTGTRGKTWHLRLRGGVPRPRSLKRIPERHIRRPNLGPHSPNSPRAVRRKSPDNSAMVRGKGRGVPPPPEPPRRKGSRWSGRRWSSRPASAFVVAGVLEGGVKWLANPPSA
jgi:hypothetical protein